METGSRQSPLVVELTEVQELLRQLEAHLDQPSGIDVCKSLASRGLSTIEKALRIARSSGLEREQKPAGDDSSRSPRSENSVRAATFPDRRGMPKKRKTEPKWTNQVRVSSGDGLDGPLGDGYSWRKYGQKHILGAKHPRSYYRCSHRNTRGCPAIKQVQRSSDNPSLFDVTYRATHTCIHEREELIRPNQQLLSFQTGLRAKTEGPAPSQSFSSTQSGYLAPEPCGLDEFFVGNISPPPFISPATSESNYFSASPRRMHGYGWGSDLQASESDLAEIISAGTSEPNSPMVDMDFMIDPVEFEPGFAFDASTFFPSDP